MPTPPAPERPPSGADGAFAPDGVLHVVAVSHLDTQWRWTIEDTIRRHLPKTLEENFARFERFPHYVVSFDGAFRYRLIEEYFPERMEALRGWIDRGRWAIAGPWLDAADVNLPSPESLVRQALYGARYFRDRFGVRPRDLFLPDCFGFGFALPSVARHCGIDGFSSQKLSKGRAARPIPFSIGRWQGVDGSWIVASLEPGGYGEPLTADLAEDPVAAEQIARLREASGVGRAQRYFGIGDTGGAPDEASLAWLERSVAAAAVRRRAGRGLDVRPGASARLFDELSPEERERLPLHRGELLLKLHATGCYSSQAAMKRWNRRNQALGAAAELAAVVADWLGAAPYPAEELASAWQRFLVHQFHDDLTGTSIPAAYRFSWNDEVLALQAFARRLEVAVGGVSQALATDVEGTPLVVFNPAATARADVVVADVALPPGPTPAAWRLVGPDGEATAVQRLAEPASSASPPGANARARIAFVAPVAASSFAVFDLAAAPRGAALRARSLPVARAWREAEGAAILLENGRLRVRIDAEGRIAQLEDLGGDRPVEPWLAAPIEIEALADSSKRFPAWEIRAEDLAAPARARAALAAPPEIVEEGPARVAVRVERRLGASRLTEWIRLGAASDDVEVETEIDWRSRRRLLKLRVAAALPTDAEPVALYDLGLGVVERGPNDASRWEVPAQRYAALVHAPSGRGLQVLCDARHGWDRPQPAVLRLTLLHTPGVGRRFRHQGRQDLGRHRLRWALRPTRRAEPAEFDAAAARFEQPPAVFQAPRHAGAAGRELAFLDLPPGVSMLALKGAETRPLAAGDPSIVLRVAESGGREVRGEARFAAPVVAVEERNGVEEPLETARPPIEPATGGRLPLDLRAFELRTWAVRLAPPPEAARLAPPRSQPLTLPGGVRAATWNGARDAADFDGRGRSYPAELLEERLLVDGVGYWIPDRRALEARGQVIALPAGWRMLHLLMAAAVTPPDEDRERRGVEGVETRLVLGGRLRPVRVPAWTGFAGTWNGGMERTTAAWVGTHRHGARGDEPYRFCYLWRLDFELGAAVRDLRLPDDPRLRLFAASVSDDPARGVRPAGLLYD